MKRLLSIVPFLLCSILTTFAEQITVPDITLVQGSSAIVEVSLNNEHLDLVAFQMDLTLPDGISIEKAGCGLSSRITDEEQELVIGKLESGAYRLISSSMSLSPFSGTDGTLLTLKLIASENGLGGQCTISNIRFSTSNSETLVLNDVTFDIRILHKYNLTYIVDGEVYKTEEVVETTPLIPEEEPTKEGYSFSGWSEIPETMPAHDVTIIGTFSINSYKLIYLVDGIEYKSYEIEYGATITPEAVPADREGYTFSGWSEIPETMPAHDVTVTGTFSINSYKLIYMVDGEEYKSYEVEYGATITPEAEPTKEGYTFSGWSEIPETMPAHDVTVTGTFTLDTGINQIMSDENGDAMIFTIDGRRVNILQKNLNIIRMKDGTTRKVMNK